MQVDLIPEWNLTTALDTEIAALLARCFRSDFGGRSFFYKRHHLRLVTREAGVIVGHMALTLRSVQLGDRLVTIAGLAEVATDPTQRGKGIAAALLQTAVAEAKASPAEYMLLFGVAKLYAAAGFHKVSNKMAHVAAKGTRAVRVVSAGDDNLMVMPLRDRPWPDAAPFDLRGPVF